MQTKEKPEFKKCEECKGTGSGPTYWKRDWDGGHGIDVQTSDHCEYCEGDGWIRIS